MGRVGGVLVLAFMRAWRLLPEPEIRTLTFVGGDMVMVVLLLLRCYCVLLAVFPGIAIHFTYMEGSSNFDF